MSLGSVSLATAVLIDYLVSWYDGKRLVLAQSMAFATCG